MSFGSALTFVKTHIDNQLGLYALIGLLLLILIYLIRPKPLQKTIPSLLFLMKDTGKSRKESFFEKLLRDFLLVFHFLLIAMLAISAMQPFFLTNKDVSKDHTVLVLDTSASMLVREGALGGTLFDKMKSKAKANIVGKTSIVVVQNEPLVALNQGKEEEAIDIISRLEPSDSLSSIGNSILAAGDLLAGEKGKVVVISDFINTDSVEPIIAKKTLEAKGVYVEFVELGDAERNNIGITKAEITEKESNILVHNFNKNPVKLEIDINGDRRAIGILPNMNEKVSFPNKEGVNSVKLLLDDDFPLDNDIKIYIPVRKKVRVLLISNQEKSYLLPMLDAYKQIWNPNMEIELAEPPKMPPIDHDLIILGPVDAGKLPGGSIDKIKQLVEKKGASFVATGFDGLHKIDLGKLMPVELDSFNQEPVEVFNLQTLGEITEDISFSKTNKYYSAVNKKDAISIANTQQNSTIIAVSDLGNGKVAYYGIVDTDSKFKFDISYPLFWQQLIDYLMNSENINNINYKIGDKVMFDEDVEVTTPKKAGKMSSIEFNLVGEHIIKGRTVYVNLFNEQESNINHNLKSQAEDDFASELGNADVKKRLITYMVYACIILLFLELLYIKVRGDL